MSCVLILQMAGSVIELYLIVRKKKLKPFAMQSHIKLFVGSKPLSANYVKGY